MITRNSIAYNIAGRLNQPINELLLEQIKFSVDYWRAFLVRQDVEKNGKDPNLVQTITISLVKVDKADNCVVDLDCSVLRTMVKVPNSVSIKQQAPFLTVQFADLKEVIGYIQYEHLAYSANGKTLKNRRFYTTTNNYIYLYNQPKLGFITVSSIFNNPLEVLNICVDDSACITDDDFYPISGHMVQILTRGILNGEFPLITNNHEIDIAADVEKRFSK